MTTSTRSDRSRSLLFFDPVSSSAKTVIPSGASPPIPSQSTSSCWRLTTDSTVREPRRNTLKEELPKVQAVLQYFTEAGPAKEASLAPRAAVVRLLDVGGDGTLEDLEEGAPPCAYQADSVRMHRQQALVWVWSEEERESRVVYPPEDVAVLSSSTHRAPQSSAPLPTTSPAPPPGPTPSTSRSVPSPSPRHLTPNLHSRGPITSSRSAS